MFILSVYQNIEYPYYFRKTYFWMYIKLIFKIKFNAKMLMSSKCFPSIKWLTMISFFSLFLYFMLYAGLHTLNTITNHQVPYCFLYLWHHLFKLWLHSNHTHWVWLQFIDSLNSFRTHQRCINFLKHSFWRSVYT